MALGSTLDTIPGLLDCANDKYSTNPTLLRVLTLPAFHSMLRRKDETKTGSPWNTPFEEWLRNVLKVGHENDDHSFCIPGEAIESLTWLSEEIESLIDVATSGNADDEEKQLGFFASTFAAIPGLVDYILDVADASARETIMGLELIRRSLTHSRSVSGAQNCQWFASRLKRQNDYQFAGTYCYAVYISTPNTWELDGKLRTDKARRCFYKLVGSQPNLLPCVLRLPDKTVEKLACTKLLVGIVDQKMAQPRMQFLLFSDAIALFGLIVCFYFETSVHDKDLGERYGDRVEFVISEGDIRRAKSAVLGFALYFFVWECTQVVAMCYASLHWDYLWAEQNLIELGVCACLFYHTRAIWYPGLGDEPELDHGHDGPYVIALITMLLSIKVLYFLKGLNSDFAKFVLCIPIILHSISSFLVVMGVFIVGFSHAFHVFEHDADEEAFGTIYVSTWSTYQIMLGQFPKDNFSRFAPACLFLIYTLIVMIVMLNVLIAVVSDGYDYAMTKSKPLFFKARLELVAELDISIFGKRHLDSIDSMLEPLMSTMKFVLRTKQDKGELDIEKEAVWEGKLQHLERTFAAANKASEKRIQNLERTITRSVTEARTEANKASEKQIKASEKQIQSLKKELTSSHMSLTEAIRNIR
jgi:hypothetical protein